MALERQLIVGDLLYGFDFRTGTSGGAPGLVSVGVDDVTIKLKRIRESVKKRFILKDKHISTVEHDELSVRWLPWVGGKINYAHSQGKDVLSGMFTGCWMAVYKEADLRVCHIATQTDNTDCKAAWRAHKGKPGVTDVKEFLPAKGLEGTFNLGLVTSTGALYKIQLQGEKTIMIPNPWSTTVEWMAKNKGNKRFEVAEYMAKLKEVNAYDIYNVSGYRVVKIEGPLTAERFPD